MFASDWVLWLIPLYAILEAFLYYRIRSRSLNLPAAGWVRAPSTWRTKTVRYLRFFPAVCALFLLIALAGPQRILTQQEILPSGIDIVISMDISGSMAAEDFQPLNRLSVAKEVLADFIRGRPSDRIGLVVFSGAGVTRSPLTLQHEPLLKTLASIQMGILPEGTAIGTGILSGVNRLAAGATTDANRGARILVLITDGRNNAGEIHPLDALPIVLQHKIKIYTIGVGSFGTVPFPVFGPDGKKTYRYEKADLDESLLLDLAQRTGGRYFRASDPKSLQLLFEQINTLEKSTPRVLESSVLSRLSSWLIVPALMIGICYAILTILIVRLP